ncbi:MAG: hypothetical protein O9289_06015 [Rhodobacteraceae bacterium]|jgi:hypothetical protein|nr:hypothetical protein [Paracoccaceae bacterium]MCZ8082743.1 hypothetical protein [Paracoccaceae bacterium]
MSGNFVYAGDLARDLGFRGMSPAFWRFCERHNIEGESGQPFRFDREKVTDVVRGLQQARQLPNRGRRGGAAHGC